MKDLFPGFYRPDARTLRALMRSANVILDSSALLNLYRYPTQAREDLLSVLDAISDRLWIPHQVALEFQQNRPAVIADQVARFREVRRVIEQAERSFVDELTRLQLDKRHSSIDPKRFVDRIRRALADFRENLDTLEQNQPDVHHDDLIREKIDSLFAGKIGSAPSQEKIEEVIASGRLRYAHKIPPGYMDQSKTEDSYVHCDVVINRQFGDLILWNEILDEMKLTNVNNLIFVTDDEKEDWWWIIKAEGTKTLGPRPELIQEIITKTNVEAFWMYNSERFLRFASEHLEIKLTKGSVESVRDVARVHSRGRTQSMALLAEQAVKAWLIDRFETVSQTVSFPDFICTDRDTGLRHGFEVKFRSQPFSVSFFIVNMEILANKMMDARNLDVCTLILVFPTLDLAEKARDELVDAKESRYPDKTRVLIGTLEGSPAELSPIHGF